MRLLLVEDDKETALTVKDELSKHYVVDVAYNGEEGLYFAKEYDYDLVILDVGLPDANGVDLCGEIRDYQPNSSILMLTGQTATESKVKALDLGADDYLTKPCEFAELLARVRALLRRQANTYYSNVITVGDLVIDANKKLVRRSDLVIDLRRKEFYLLEYLAKNAGQVMTREMILNHVWERDSDPETNVVDVHIKYLRNKIDKPFDKKLVKTVHGIGYKIEG